VSEHSSSGPKTIAGLRYSEALLDCRPPGHSGEVWQVVPAGVSPTKILNPAGVSPTKTLNPAGVSPTKTLNPAGVSPTKTLNPAGVSPTETLNSAGVSPTKTLTLQEYQLLKP
jgi:hypothetical protein